MECGGQSTEEEKAKLSASESWVNDYANNRAEIYAEQQVGGASEHHGGGRDYFGVDASVGFPVAHTGWEIGKTGVQKKSQSSL